MRPDAVIALATHLAILVGLSTCFSMLLRSAGIPGGRPAGAAVGGLLAGILLGATVAGRAWPAWHERVVSGGTAERAALEALAARQQADATALRATGVTHVALAELAADHARERAAAEDRLASAREEHRRPRVFALAVLLAVALACTVWGARRHPSRTPDPPTPGEAFAAVMAGVIATAFAALPTALLLMWLADLPLEASLTCGGAVAAGSVFAGLPLRWTPRSGRLVESRAIALCTTVVAALVFAWGLRPAAAAWILLPAAGMLGGAAFARIFPAGPSARRAARAVVTVIVMPAVIAFVTQQVDWLGVWSGWGITLLLGLGLVSAGDGHFIGAWLALQTFAPERMRASAGGLAVELVASGLGLTQAAMALVLIASGAIEPDSLSGQAALGLLLLNAVVIEVMAPASRRVLRAL